MAINLLQWTVNEVWDWSVSELKRAMGKSRRGRGDEKKNMSFHHLSLKKAEFDPTWLWPRDLRPWRQCQEKLGLLVVFRGAIVSQTSCPRALRVVWWIGMQLKKDFQHESAYIHQPSNTLPKYRWLVSVHGSGWSRWSMDESISHLTCPTGLLTPFKSIKKNNKYSLTS